MGKFSDYITGKELKTTKTPEDYVKFAKLMAQRISKMGQYVNKETQRGVIDSFKKEHDLTEADMTPILAKALQIVGAKK